jgi:DNA-directed RNA polymerase specialized sigma24 family protein
MPSPELRRFLQILQSGDEQAVEVMLRELDPFLRKVIRMRLVDGRLRRVLDTTDIFDSLLKDFLTRDTNCQTPGQSSAGLRAYLAAAVHHKIQTKARKERRHAGSLPDGWEPVDPEATPTSRIEDEDMQEAVRRRLPADAQSLFHLKAQGLSWNEIAGRVGGTPDALRMRLTRAVAAALHDLGCNGTSHVESC